MTARSRCLAAEATVLGIDAEGYVELEFNPGSRCAGCTGLCALGRERQQRRARFKSNVPLAPGTAVRVMLPADHIMKSAVVLHGLPLAALLAGAAMGSGLAGSDIGTLLGAVAGLAAAVPASQGLRRKTEAMTMLRATLTPVRSSRDASDEAERRRSLSVERLEEAERRRSLSAERLDEADRRRSLSAGADSVPEPPPRVLPQATEAAADVPRMAMDRTMQ